MFIPYNTPTFIQKKCFVACRVQTGKGITTIQRMNTSASIV